MPRPFSVRLSLTIAALLFPTALLAQHKSTASQAEHIASQPARDVGLAKTKVPRVLRQAAKAPYAVNGTGSCASLSSGIRALSGALGPDFGERTRVTESKAGQIAKIGGESIVNSIIPFRGLVREVSGAAAAQRRLQAATYAGLARRGFLRGLYKARNCRTGL